MPAFNNSKEVIIRNRLAGISAMKDWEFDDDYVAKRLKEYVLFCLRHQDKDMRNAIAKIVNAGFPQFKELVEKYMVLL